MPASESVFVERGLKNVKTADEEGPSAMTFEGGAMPLWSWSKASVSVLWRNLIHGYPDRRLMAYPTSVEGHNLLCRQQIVKLPHQRLKHLLPTALAGTHLAA